MWLAHWDCQSSDSGLKTPVTLEEVEFTPRGHLGHLGFIFYFSDEETDGPQFTCSETALTPVLKSTAKSINNCAVGLLDAAPSTGSGLEVRQHSQEGYYLLYRSPLTSAHKDFRRPIPINPESMGNFSLKTTTTQ